MNFSQAFKMAAKSISANKGRSALTMLGVIIGLAAVIILVSYAQGQNMALRAYYESMGTQYHLRLRLLLPGGMWMWPPPFTTTASSWTTWCWASPPRGTSIPTPSSSLSPKTISRQWQNMGGRRHDVRRRIPPDRPGQR